METLESRKQSLIDFLERELVELKKPGAQITNVLTDEMMPYERGAHQQLQPTGVMKVQVSYEYKFEQATDG